MTPSRSHTLKFIISTVKGQTRQPGWKWFDEHHQWIILRLWAKLQFYSAYTIGDFHWIFMIISAEAWCIMWWYEPFFFASSNNSFRFQSNCIYIVYLCILGMKAFTKSKSNGDEARVFVVVFLFATLTNVATVTIIFADCWSLCFGSHLKMIQFTAPHAFTDRNPLKVDGVAANAHTLKYATSGLWVEKSLSPIQKHLKYPLAEGKRWLWIPFSLSI